MNVMKAIGSLTGAKAPSRRFPLTCRVVSVLACMLCFAALLVVCVACGPAFTDEDKAAFAGRWELVSFGVEPETKAKDDASAEKADDESAESDGESADSAGQDDSADQPEESDEEKAAKEKQMSTFDVLLYKEWGLTSDLTLADDGTCTFNFYGDQYVGTWEMKGKTEASVELVVQNEDKPQKETYGLILKDGLLTMTVQDMPVVFQKRDLPKESDEE